MKRQHWLFLNLFLFVILFHPVTVLSAPYYEGKRIAIIVGFGPGGGYDRLARLLAKYLPRSKPSKLAENLISTH